MKDLQGNKLELGDIVYCCCNGRSKRLVKSQVIEIQNDKTAVLHGVDEIQRFRKTSATIVKAFDQTNP